MYNPLCTVTLSRLALATFLGDENQHFYFFFVYNIILYDIIILWLEQIFHVDGNGTIALFGSYKYQILADDVDPSSGCLMITVYSYV